jgi:hypothetical protein
VIIVIFNGTLNIVTAHRAPLTPFQQFNFTAHRFMVPTMNGVNLFSQHTPYHQSTMHTQHAQGAQRGCIFCLSASFFFFHSCLLVCLVLCWETTESVRRDNKQVELMSVIFLVPGPWIVRSTVRSTSRHGHWTRRTTGHCPAVAARLGRQTQGMFDYIFM